MANWINVATPPKKSGRYRAKCGNSGDTFWALWWAKDKVWTNLKREEIAFGRPECVDTWRDAYKSVRSNATARCRVEMMGYGTHLVICRLR